MLVADHDCVIDVTDIFASLFTGQVMHQPLSGLSQPQTSVGMGPVPVGGQEEAGEVGGGVGGSHEGAGERVGGHQALQPAPPGVWAHGI